MKKGQISTEVMYSVGVMVLIFLLLLGIGFDLRVELRHLDDILQRKAECNRLSTIISETAISSYYTISKTVLKNNAYVFRSGVIEIWGHPGRMITTSATCTFSANIHLPFLPDEDCVILYARSPNTGVEQTVYILNYLGNVSIQTTPYGVIRCPR